MSWEVSKEVFFLLIPKIDDEYIYIYIYVLVLVQYLELFY